MKRLLVALSVIIRACDRPVAPPPNGSTATASAAPPTTAPVASTSASSAPAPSSSAAAPRASGSITFDDEAIGGPSRSFDGIVGDWYVAEEGGAHGLEVDGGKWKSGTPSASIADQAKRLYGERYAEFLDGVKAFAFFPFAVYEGEVPPGDLRISVRFYPIAGSIDQAAGIAFGIGADGSYWGVRVNALENNLLYFKVVKGHRTVIDDVRNVPTPSKTWHVLAMDLRGKHLSAELDGKKTFEKDLDALPSGRIGLWSKADSRVLFDDFTVEPIAERKP